MKDKLTHLYITDWDRIIMKKYPYFCDIALKNSLKHDDIIEELENTLDKETFTWKGGRFFFLSKDDCLLFTLKYG